MGEGGRGWERLVELHERALALPADERRGLVAQLARREPELAAELQGMLHGERPPGFLDSPLGERSGPAGLEGLIGRRIGRFEVVRGIGRGGMGVVLEAVQENPRRRVALKVLASPLASESLRRRFEVEAEVLGGLQHPGIAQVFEAGVEHFESGFELPYLAMELVEGARHLPEYCDEQGLDVRARTRLFVEVCRAVHAAHQNGVLHRDLKPSNLLVDGAGRVRVIDFGVARAGRDGARTGPGLTRTGELVGTPAYMSPEQCAGRSEEIDVRSDVWALGVVFYELLAGRLPFDAGTGSATDLLRLHERPPAALSRVAPEVPLDLDWIVAKALETDRARRYASVSELAADLERWLAHEPVLATPPGRLYRTRKFVRRNRLAVGAAVGIGAALLVGSVLATVGLVRARAAEREAREDEQLARDEAAKFAGMSRVLADLLASARPELDGIDARVVDLLERGAATVDAELADQPEVRKALHGVLAQSFLSLGSWEDAAEQAQRGLALARDEGPLDEESELALVAVAAGAERGLDDPGSTARYIEEGLAAAREGGLEETEAALGLRRQRAVVRIDEGHYEEALDELRGLRADVERALGGESPLALLVLRTLVRALDQKGHLAEAEETAAELVELTARVRGPGHLRTLFARKAHALAVARNGRTGEACALLEPVVPALRELAGEEHYAVLTILNDLGALYLKCGRLHEAQTVLEVALEARERLDGPEHRETLKVREHLAQLATYRGDPRSAAEAHLAAIAALRGSVAPDHPRLATALANFGFASVQAGRFEEAREAYAEALAIRLERFGPTHVETLYLHEALGVLDAQQLDFASAEGEFRAAYIGYRDGYGHDDPRALKAGNNLVVCLGRLGRAEEAIPLAEELLLRHEKIYAPDDPALVSEIINLAALYDLRGSALEAEALFRRARRHVAEHLPPDHELQSKVLEDLANHLTAQRRPEEALALYEEAIQRAEESERILKLPLASHYRGFARALAEYGDLEAAVDAAEEAHRLFGTKLPADDELVLRAVRELAELLERAGRADEAARWRERLGAR